MTDIPEDIMRAVADVKDELLGHMLVADGGDIYMGFECKSIIASALMAERDAAEEKWRRDYLTLATHIAPDLDEAFIMSHLPEQVIDVGLQRRTV